MTQESSPQFFAFTMSLSLFVALVSPSRVCCVAVCCGVLRCVAVCCSALQCVAVQCRVLQCAAACCSVLQYEPALCPPTSISIQLVQYIWLNPMVGNCFYWFNPMNGA